MFDCLGIDENTVGRKGVSTRTVCQSALDGVTRKQKTKGGKTPDNRKGNATFDLSALSYTLRYTHSSVGIHPNDGSTEKKRMCK